MTAVEQEDPPYQGRKGYCKEVTDDSCQAPAGIRAGSGFGAMAAGPVASCYRCSEDVCRAEACSRRVLRPVTVRYERGAVRQRRLVRVCVTCLEMSA